jgi:hypothetical protein
MVSDFSQLPHPRDLDTSTADDSTSRSGTNATNQYSPYYRAKIIWRDKKLFDDLDLPIPFALGSTEGSSSSVETLVDMEEPIVSKMNYRDLISASLYPLSRYTGFMLDDHRILAFRVCLFILYCVRILLMDSLCTD